MTNILLSGTDFSRLVAKTSHIQLKNRFAEKNPVLSEDPVAVISRPSLKKLAEVGSGPIRKVYSASGVFSGDLFVVSNDTLYTVSVADGSVTTVGTISTDISGAVSMAATAPIGDTVPAYMYIADGVVLWVYTDNGHATGHLQVTGSISNGDVVRIDGTYYKFTTGSVDTGTPAGTSGSPWLVQMNGLSTAQILTNLFNAINASGTAGTDYSTLLTVHTTVHGYSYSTADLYVEALTAGTLGNSIVTTETSAGAAWSAGTLAGGGSPQLRQVTMPNDYGAVSVVHINSYIIVVPVQDTAIKGRFYWIEPGENTVDPLNFATAERNPDGIHQAVVFGDMFWLLGENTTEPWITTGTITAPMARFKGILFDRGSWEGTAVQVKDSLIVVDEDGAVFQISGGQKRISRPDIEERIRRAMQTQAQLT